ncbi:Uncharacterised protein [Brevundimonas diminuta]|nr:Uncharacterised protein [Brevundimonas diminuta]
MKDFYSLMLNRGLVTSRRQCSVYYCKMAPNYLCVSDPSDTALINAFRRLVSEGRWSTAFRVAHMVLFDQR